MTNSLEVFHQWVRGLPATEIARFNGMINEAKEADRLAGRNLIIDPFLDLVVREAVQSANDDPPGTYDAFRG